MSEQKTAPDSPELLSNWQQLLKQINEHAAPVPNAEDLKKSELFINRELSWLDFNDRVLNEAADATVPPLERLRFVAIVSSNLDEFFMIRVAEIARTVAADPGQRYPDGLKASEVYGQIRERVLAQKTRQAQVFSEIIETLRQNGIEIHAHFNGDTELDAGIKERLPLVKIFLRQAKDAFPALPAGRIHVFVRFAKEYAILSIEDKAGRLIELPGSRRFALAERWLCAKAAELFPGREVIEAFPFKIIREANMRVRPEDEETLEEQIIQGLEGRSRGKPVRLEVDAPQYSEGAFFLATTLRLDSAAMYRFDLPLDLMTLMRIYDSDERDLRYPAIEPKLPSPLENPQRMFALLRRHDILLHHPYDSFDAIVNLMDQAARDPQVKRIYHTIYRAGQQSPLMESLKEACRQGKKVTVYVEIKARFDELNNMRWMSELKKAGASVVPALGHFKVHSKVTQIIREENGGEVSYLHLGTGNYHPKTARQYTDLGLLTSDATLGSDISAFFETISRRQSSKDFKEILVAPANLQAKILQLIKQEIQYHEKSGAGRIIAKINSLVDTDIIQALYRASQVGVRVDLIVRGICCLRPGLKGLSENIKVTSIIDRFLEHSRIFYFRQGGEEKVYLSSGDWMPRNFYARYEIAFPVKDPVLKVYLRDTVLGNSLADNAKAWTLQPDSRYVRSARKEDESPYRSQFVFTALADNFYRDTILATRAIELS